MADQDDSLTLILGTMLLNNDRQKLNQCIRRVCISTSWAESGQTASRKIDRQT